MSSVLMGSTLLGLALVSAGAAASDTEAPAVKLLDMYAKAEADHYVVHIVASGDISQYKTSRKVLKDSYKLILDVPALPPLPSRYDVTTPFSRRFEVWPMMLEARVYSRVAMEFDLEATTVIGQESPSRIFITISRHSPEAVAALDAKPTLADDTESASGAAPEPENGGTPEVDGAPVASEQPAPDTGADATAPPIDTVSNPASSSGPGEGGKEFFSLFPLPAGEQRPIFNVAIDQYAEEALYDGFRFGRFLVRPALYAGWLRGNNLALRSDEDFEDSAITLRARSSFELLESAHPLKFTYEGRYRDYQNYPLTHNFSHFVDFSSEVNFTPRMVLRLQDHFVQGVTESAEFDPGREIGFATDPFLRNRAGGALAIDLSERLGVELYGSYDRVHFLEENTTFYDYDTGVTGASFLYYLSPLTTVLGSYQREVVPEPVARPEARSKADALLVGMRGEITPLLVGTIRGGYQRQEFGPPGEELHFRGLVADAKLIRQFSEEAFLSVETGRTNNPSNFEENGYYTSNYLGLRFVAPVWRDLRMTLSGIWTDNRYPLASVDLGVPRKDRIIMASAGLAYFFTRRSFLQVDFLHEQRDSNLASVQYRNNVIQLLLGWGFLSQ